jgi:hypothetical protein
MRFRVWLGALAFCGALGAAHAAPDASRSADLFIEACFSGAPDAAAIGTAARAAGGVAVSDAGFANAHASIENPNHVGLWRAQGAWTLGYSEGHLGGLPARACYGAEIAEPAPALLSRIGARWPLYAVMTPTRAADGQGLRETYAAELNGRDALVIVEWAGDRDQAHPAVTVVTFPNGAQARAASF